MSSESELTQVVGHVALLRAELRGLLRDVKAARREVEELRAEVRAETGAIRADMARMMSRQNSRSDDNKKKLPGSLPALGVSTGD